MKTYEDLKEEYYNQLNKLNEAMMNNNITNIKKYKEKLSTILNLMIAIKQDMIEAKNNN